MKTEQQIKDEIEFTEALLSDYKRNDNFIGTKTTESRLETLAWVLELKKLQVKTI